MDDKWRRLLLGASAVQLGTEFLRCEERRTGCLPRSPA